MGKCIVLALHVPGGKRRDALIYGFRPPRTTVLVPVSSSAPDALAIAVGGLGAPDATILIPPDLAEEKTPDALLGIRPKGTLLLVDPAEARRFLWYFRDAADPLTLGHAGEQDVTGPD